MPCWVDQYLTPAQLERMLERTMWALVIGKAQISSAAHHVGLRLYLWALSSIAAEAWPSVASLCRETKLARNTVRAAIRDLEAQGWIVAERRTYESGKTQSTLYRLSWPALDVVASVKRIRLPKCGGELKHGGDCTKPAGWGTDVTEGPCVHHGGLRAGGQPLTPTRSTSDPSEGVNHCPPGGQPLTPNGLVSGESLNGERSCAQRSLSEPERREAELRFANGLRAEGRDEREIARLLTDYRERVAS